jgi:hypothetical protein
MKKRMIEWMGRKNKLFSAICGETFTNGEVVFTHLGLVAFFVVLGVVGGWE